MTTKTTKTPVKKPSKKVAKIKVVFLDFDGVINSYHNNSIGFDREPTDVLDPKRIAYVERICAQTGAKIVLSTAWREFYDMDTLKRFLRQRGLTAPIIGRTPSYAGVDRGYEVEGWLAETDYEVEGFVCLDDLNEFRMMRKHHVHTDAFKGLEEKHVAQACRILTTVEAHRPVSCHPKRLQQMAALARI